MNDSDNKIAKIYDVVLELVNRQNNPMKITISEIADKSGIGKGTVYEYFKSKEDVFVQAFKYYTELMINDIKLIREDSFKKLFFAYYEQLKRMQKKCNAAYLTIMLGDNKLIQSELMDESIKKILFPLQNCLSDFTRKLIEQGISEGILRENIETYNIYFACMGIVATIFTSNSEIGEQIYTDKSLASADSCYKCFIKLLN